MPGELEATASVDATSGSFARVFWDENEMSGKRKPITRSNDLDLCFIMNLFRITVGCVVASKYYEARKRTFEMRYPKHCGNLSLWISSALLYRWV